MCELFDYGRPQSWEVTAIKLVDRLFEDAMRGNLAFEFSDTMRERNGVPWLITLDPDGKFKIVVHCLVSNFVPRIEDEEEIPETVKFVVRSPDGHWEFAVNYHFPAGLEADWHNNRCILADHTCSVASALGDADALRSWLMMWRLLTP